MGNVNTIALKGNRKMKIQSSQIREAIQAYLMIAPFVILMVTFTFIPFIAGAILSLTDAQGINEGEFIGFANFIQAFKEKDFWMASKATFSYTLGCLATQIPIAFILAYFLNNIAFKFRGLLRASFFIPVLINQVITALLFRMLFNKDQGIINWILGMLHLPNNIGWINDSAVAIPLLVIVSFWQWMGFHMVYFLAYLQTINSSIYDAAKIDGASGPRVLFQIILPMIRPAFTFVFITAAIGGLQMFDYVFLVFPNTTFGPGGVARTFMGYIYQQAFSQKFLLGYASAVGWIFFLIVFIVSLLQLRILKLGSKD